MNLKMLKGMEQARANTEPISEGEARKIIYHKARRHFPDWPSGDFDYLVEFFVEIAKELSGLNPTQRTSSGHFGLFRIHVATFREIRLYLQSKGIPVTNLLSADQNAEAYFWHVRYVFDHMPPGAYILKEKLFLSVLGASFWPFFSEMRSAVWKCKRKYGAIDAGLLDMPPHVEAYALQLRRCEIAATHRTIKKQAKYYQPPIKEELCQEPV